LNLPGTSATVAISVDDTRRLEVINPWIVLTKSSNAPPYAITIVAQDEDDVGPVGGSGIRRHQGDE
jgi:hypothetical protein